MKLWKTLVAVLGLGISASGALADSYDMNANHYTMRITCTENETTNVFKGKLILNTEHIKEAHRDFYDFNSPPALSPTTPKICADPGPNFANYDWTEQGILSLDTPLQNHHHEYIVKFDGVCMRGSIDAPNRLSDYTNEDGKTTLPLSVSIYEFFSMSVQGITPAKYDGTSFVTTGPFYQNAEDFSGTCTFEISPDE